MPTSTVFLCESSVPAATPVRKPPLPALTGIRTILALNILFFHFTPPHMTYLYPVMNNGYVFVGFFFLLSGFILAYNYSDRALTLSPRHFWVARAARLYPVYLLALALSFKMLQAEWTARPHAQFLGGLLLTPLLLQGWSPPIATFWNTVGWTLSAEVMLYLAFPYILRAWATHHQHRAFVALPGSASKLVLLFFGLWVAGLLPHTLYLLLNPDHLASPANRYTSAFFLRCLKYTPPAYLCTFLAGITLGKIQGVLTPTPHQRFMLTALALALTTLFFYTAVPHTPYVLMHGGLLTPLFGAIILGLSGPHALATLFASRPLARIGETTLCLYLLHFNTINLIHLYHLPERLHVAALEPWISYAAAIALAFAAFHLVEKPARRAIMNRFAPRTQPIPGRLAT